jgi:hypothetical protein
MRWPVGAALAILAAGALAVGAPSVVIGRQMTVALRAHMEPGGSVQARVRATAWGLARQRVDRIQVNATGIRLGDLVADRLRADLSGVQFERSPTGWVPTHVGGGGATAEIGRARLEQFLRDRGVEQPEVLVAPSGITVAGAMPAGGARVPMRVAGQFEPAGRDLRFRVASLEIGGAEVPRQLAETLATLVQPVISLSRLPIPLIVDRVTVQDGRLVVGARAGEAP